MKILMSGDSWGCGEWKWNHNDNPISHKGIEQYFIDDGHTVDNFSCGGASNELSVHKIKTNFQKKYNFVIWIQSDPLRDIGHEILKEKNLTYRMILDEQKRLLDINYENLNSFGIEIICIGGCSKINLDLVKKYENLTIAIPSIPEFLLENYTYPEVCYNDDWSRCMGNHANYHCVEKLFNAKNDIQIMRDNAEFFHPDGKHPNRKGLWLVYHKLLEFINTA